MAATIAEAYVQILPTTNGITGALTSSLGGAATTAGAAAGAKASSSFGTKFSTGLATVGKVGAAALTASTVAVTAFGTSAVKAGSEFDSAMSQVAATMGYTTNELNDDTTEASQNMATLRDFAQEMGNTTSFSASEAAEALNYMALAGYDAETAMGMLPSVLSLAEAGNMGLADASNMVTDAASALNLTLEDGTVDIEKVTNMIDQMAAASSDTNTTVSELGDAILTIGATAADCADGTQELSTVLGVLADNGIHASEGGTHLRNIITSLQEAAEDGSVAFGDFSVAVYDDGKMRNTIDIITDMKEGLGDLSQESRNAILSGVFNKTDLASIKALLNTTEERFNGLTESIGNSTGASEEMAKTMKDNLSGDITSFKSALEGVKIAVSDELTPTLREFVTFGANGLRQLKTAFTTDGIDGAVSAFGTILTDGLTMITSKLPEVVTAGATLLQSLVTGITQNSSTIVGAAVSILNTLISTIGTLVPQLLDAGLQIVTQLVLGISSALPSLIPTAISMLNEIKNSIITNLPLLLDAAITLLKTLATSITDNLGDLMETGADIIAEVEDAIVGSAPELATAAMEIITQLVLGLIDNMPQVVSAMITIRTSMMSAILNNLPELVEAGITIIGQYIAGVTQEIPHLIEMFPEMIDKIAAKFTEYDWSSIGTAIIQGIKNGILNATSLIKDAAKAAAQSAYDAAKNKLNINSPSKLFRDDIGKAIPEGMALGIDNNTKYVTDAMDDLSTLTAQSISTDNILRSSQKYSDSAELSGASDSLAEGTHITIEESINMGDTKLKEIISEYVITKIGNETRAVKIAQGGYY